MKTIKSLLAVSTGLMLASAVPVFAIEGLQISVQCSNVVLSWPSAEGETYIVQYRQTLDVTDVWQTLTSSLPAASVTNITIFVHSNIVQNPCCGCDGNSFAAMDSSENVLSMEMVEPIAPMLMAISTNGTGDGVPVMLYPPGFDLSGFVIFDPVTGESVSGVGYSTSAFALSSPLFDGLQPLDGGSGSGGDGPALETGFYQVVRVGAHLMGITNGMTLSGTVTIPVEVGNDSGALVNLSLTENGAPVNGSSSEAPPIPLPLQLTVDTTQMSNGVHQISASARWDDTNGGVWEADSPAVTVNIYNEITFPNWMPRFGELGNTLMIAVQSAHTNADWWIDIYDSQYAYIGTFAGQTYDGSIEGAWNLLGPHGEYHSDNTFHFVVTTEFTDSSMAQGSAGPADTGTATAVSPPSFKVTDPWSGPGAWVAVVQHAFDGVIGHDPLYQEWNGSVQGVQGIGWSVYPNPDAEGNPYAISFQNGSQEVTDWTAFRNALYNPQSRNLLYLGHGGPDNFGYNWSDTNTSISAKEIANRLHTIPDNQTNRHAYRFVFLDGCATSKGTLPEAFGVIHRPIDDVYYYSGASIRPNAFIGWDADKNISIWGLGTLFYSHVNFIIHIQYDMAINGDGIKDAIAWAANQPDVSWWLWTSELQVFGWTGLHFYQYNN